MTGAPVDKFALSFCFSDATTIYFTCDECDKNILVNDKIANVITAIPLSTGIDGFLTANLTHYASSTFRDNDFEHLTFHVQDEKSNNLPVQRIIYRLIINDECLPRENIP